MSFDYHSIESDDHLSRDSDLPNLAPSIYVAFQGFLESPDPRRFSFAGLGKAHPLAHKPWDLFLDVTDADQCLILSQARDRQTCRRLLISDKGLFPSRRFDMARYTPSQEGHAFITHRFIHTAERLV